jgi:acetolactate synthase-1/2/3 large subunit
MSCSASSLLAAATQLSGARRPAILVGPEGATAVATILAVARLLGAPVLTTPDALSLVDARRSTGVYSFGATARAKRAVARADVVLAVSALGEFACRLGEAFAAHTLIQVTEQVTHVWRKREPDLPLVGEVDAILSELLAVLARTACAPRRPWFRQSLATSRRELAPARAAVIHPESAIRAIQSALPEQVRVCLDVTSGALHAYEHLRLKEQQRVFSSIENSACMGEALLASLGVRLASGLPTLVVVGDWGQCMTPPELHTAVELELDRYVVVVWANGGGAFVEAGVRQQRISVPERAFRWRVSPDFARMASAYGARGVVVGDAAALEREVFRGLRAAETTLIEARLDVDVPIPAGDRFLTLGEVPLVNLDTLAVHRALLGLEAANDT